MRRPCGGWLRWAHGGSARARTGAAGAESVCRQSKRLRPARRCVPATLSSPTARSITASLLTGTSGSNPDTSIARSASARSRCA